MTVPSPPTPIRPRLPIVAGLLFVDMLGFSALLPLIPELQRQLGVSEVAIGILVAGMPLGAALLTLPMGRVTDVVGPRRVTVAGSVLVGVSFLAFAFLDTYGWLVAARVLQGVGSTALWVAGPAWVALGDEAGRARRLATTTGAGMAGTIVGAGLGGWMAAAYGLLSSFVLLGVLVLAGAVVTLLATRRPALQPPPTIGLLATLAAGFRSARFRTGAGATMLAALIGAAESAVLALALGREGLDERALGVWMSLAGVALVVGQVSGPRVASHIGMRRTMAIAGAFAGGLAVAAAVAPTVPLLLVMLVGLPLPLGWLYGLSLDLLAGGATEAGSTAAIGIAWWNLTWAIGATLGPVAITATLQAADVGAAIALVAGFAAAVVVVVVRGLADPLLRSRTP
jgi:predicted MFS family arabinose efflux permease